MESIYKTVVTVFFLSLVLCHVAAAGSSSTKDILQGMKNIVSPQESAAEKQVGSLLKSVTEAVSKYSEEVSHGASLLEVIQADFKQLTQQSNELLVATLKINAVSAPLQGYVIPEGLGAISKKINEVSGHLVGGDTGLHSLNKDDAKLVVESLSDFVQAHQKMLSAVISKHELSVLFVFFGRILQNLESLEGSLDNFAFNLIALIPTEQSAATSQFRSLSQTLQKAIVTYSSSVQMA